MVERLLVVRLQVKHIVTDNLGKKRGNHQRTVNAHGRDVDMNQNTSSGINVMKSIVAERLTGDFEQAIRESTASGDLATVVRLLKHILSLDNVFVNVAAVHAAAQNGQLRIVEKLLNPKAGTDGMSPFGQMALYVAAEYGHLDAVQTFIKAGIKVAPIGPDGETALHAAARHGGLGIVYELLKFNVDVNQRTMNDFQGFGSTTMQASMRALVQARMADTVTSPNFISGCTALHLAAEHGHLEILKCLLEAGADCEILAYNDDGFFLAAHLALRQGHKEAATTLAPSLNYNSRLRRLEYL